MKNVPLAQYRTEESMCFLRNTLTDGVPKVPKAAWRTFWHFWHFLTLGISKELQYKALSRHYLCGCCFSRFQPFHLGDASNVEQIFLPARLGPEVDLSGTERHCEPGTS